MPPPPSSSGFAGDEYAGRVLGGRYELEHPLATGGMAQVWVARDQVLARPVAVKLLHRHLVDDRAFVSRFRAEALAAARLSHPSIVSVYDTCAEPGIEAIVMELVKGRTLRALLDDRGPLGPAEACTIGSRIAEALGVAHRAGIVHRDVKPANVLLSDDGRVVVTDFGIAKATESADLTTDRQMLGTAKYLAPEQVEGEPVDGRTDLYALGVVLYEMVCGQVPFQASTEASTALARLHRDPTPPRQLRPDIPAPIEDVILRALARRPDDRWPDAAAMSRALNSAARTRPVATPGPADEGDEAGADDPTEAVPRFAPRAEPPRPVSTLAPPRPLAAPAPDPPRGIPAARNPDPDPDPRATRPEPRRRRRRMPLVAGAALVVLALVVVGLLAIQVLGGGRDPERLAVTPATFDPAGDGAENDDQVGAATDRDPATTWSTEHYRDPDITRLKDGVGLLLQLETPRSVDRLEVTSPTTDWNAQVYVLDARPDGPLSGWGEPVTGAEDIDGDQTFDLGGREGGVVILWITRTGAEGTVEIAEAVVTG